MGHLVVTKALEVTLINLLICYRNMPCLNSFIELKHKVIQTLFCDVLLKFQTTVPLEIGASVSEAPFIYVRYC